MHTVYVVHVCSDSEEDTSEKSADEDSLRSTLEELTEVQFQFEVKAVRSSSLCSHHNQLSSVGARGPHFIKKNHSAFHQLMTIILCMIPVRVCVEHCVFQCEVMYMCLYMCVCRCC